MSPHTITLCPMADCKEDHTSYPCGGSFNCDRCIAKGHTPAADLAGLAAFIDYLAEDQSEKTFLAWLATANGIRACDRRAIRRGIQIALNVAQLSLALNITTKSKVREIADNLTAVLKVAKTKRQLQRLLQERTA